MSQGIFSALAYLENQIESITPKSDVHHGFVCHTTGGLAPPLEERRNQTRYFELMIDGMPEDDGAAGLSGRRRATINCRVRYDIPEDIALLSRLIAEDAEYILTKLKGPNYSLSTTGIVSVIPESPGLEVINVGEAEAHILSIPFIMLYLEA